MLMKLDSSSIRSRFITVFIQKLNARGADSGEAMASSSSALSASSAKMPRASFTSVVFTSGNE